MSEKSDILTPWKEMDRRRREVYSVDGVPDGAVRRGMYHRAWNSHHPHLNSTDGKVPLPIDLRVGAAEPRFHRDPNAVNLGDVYDLRIVWGRQVRIKCPGCCRFVRAALEISCACGSVYSQTPEVGHYQIVRLCA